MVDRIDCQGCTPEPGLDSSRWGRIKMPSLRRTAALVGAGLMTLASRGRTCSSSANVAALDWRQSGRRLWYQGGGGFLVRASRMRILHGCLAVLLAAAAGSAAGQPAPAPAPALTPASGS